MPEAPCGRLKFKSHHNKLGQVSGNALAMGTPEVPGVEPVLWRRAQDTPQPKWFIVACPGCPRPVVQVSLGCPHRPSRRFHGGMTAPARITPRGRFIHGWGRTHFRRRGPHGTGGSHRPGGHVNYPIPITPCMWRGARGPPGPAWERLGPALVHLT